MMKAMLTQLAIQFIGITFALTSLSVYAWQPGQVPIPSKGELKKILSPIQFKVTQEDGTEPPFKNEYNSNKSEGIYVDIVSGEPLFSSKDKYDSRTGWPSFTKPLVPAHIVEKEDRGWLLQTRTEVRSKHGNSHLGHVFKDGPKPTGLRYCLNSAALRFIPREKLNELGYGEFRAEFAFVEAKPKTTAAATVTAPEVASATATPKAIAIFAGGCFWCMEPPFDKLEKQGVISVRSGYAGGSTENPTYKEVSSGKSDHIEVIEVTYDPEKISFAKLLKTYWRNIDPYDGEGQFCDKGPQYKSAVFYATESEKKDYLKSIEDIAAIGIEISKIKTQFLPKTKFYPAEEYHQDYYEKNPLRYKYYRTSCGRDKRLKELWKN